MSVKTTLTKLLTALESRTGDTMPTLYAYEAKDTSLASFVVYEYNTSYNDRVVRKDMLKLNITASTYSDCLDVQEKIENRLLTLGDRDLDDPEIVKVEETAGNMTYNDETGAPHVVIMFIITARAGLSVN